VYSCRYPTSRPLPPPPGSALEIIDGAARIDRCKFIKNTRLEDDSLFNPLSGGAAVVYASTEPDEDRLPPLVVSRSSFVKNEAFGPGGAIIAYNVPDPFAFESRVRFRRNVSQQNSTLGDFFSVDIPLP